ncbi:hypothetical protein CROQUDRAFT_694510, partial [Cronartium quercuum f. sp. fusiforme G11]
MASTTHPVSNLNPIELGTEELTLIRSLLPPLKNGVTFHTGTIKEGLSDYQRITNQMLKANSNGSLFYIPEELRELLSCDARSYQEDDLTNRCDDSPDNSPHMEPTTSEEEGHMARVEVRPAYHEPKGKAAACPAKDVSASMKPNATTRGERIVYPSVPQPSIRAGGDLPAKIGLDPSPSFLDRISGQPPTSVPLALGITAQELANFRAYQKALTEPDSLASKIQGISLVTSTTTPNPSMTLPQTMANNHFRRAVTTTPVAEVIVVEDDEEEIGLEKEKDSNVIVKSLAKANIKKYMGTQDVESYWSQFKTDTDMRFCHPALSAAVHAKTEPKTFCQLVAFFMNHFPSTLSIQSIDKCFDNLHQNEGKTVLAYWTCHQELMKDADEVGYKYDLITAFTKWLIKNKVYSHVKDELSHFRIAGIDVAVDKLALIAIERDSWDNIRHDKLRARCDYINTISNSNNGHSQPHKCKSDKDHRGRKHANTQTCYNCSKPGHIFGPVDNPICKAPIMKHTHKYLEEKAANGPVANFELALVAPEEEPPVEHLSPTWLKGFDNFSDSRESLNVISRECLEDANSSIVINLMSWYKKPEDKYSQGDKSQLEPLGRVEDGPSTGPVESGHGCLTSADEAASLPASKPGLSAEGTIGPRALNCLATLDNGASENRTDFVLTIDGVSTHLLLDTGAEKSYASESYTKRRRVALSNNPDRPLVNGVW